MNILFLAHRIPFPPNKGDKIRSFNEISYLSRKHNLYLAFLIDDPKDIVYVDELKKYCEGLDYDIIRPRWQKIKSIPYLFTEKPLSIPYFYSKRLQDAVDRRLEKSRIDAIIAFSSSMAEYVFKSKLNLLTPPFGKGGQGGILQQGAGDYQAKLIMDFVDVDSDKWRMYAGFSTFPYSVVYRREWKRLMDYERKVGTAFDLSIFVSEKEAVLFKSFCPEAHTLSIPNGVDLEFFNTLNLPPLQGEGQGGDGLFSNEKNSERNGPNLLFMGAMDYFPNEDAVLYFYSEIWPYIKKELSHAKFYVVGGNPPKKVRDLSEKDRDIVITGFVPDVRPYLENADIFVAPFRIARGVQNKVLEAMAAGVPVVARPEAVQGLNGLNGCIIVEENNERFAMSILKIIKTPQKRHQMINSSKEFVIKNYNWGKNLEKWNKIVSHSL